MFVVRHRIIFFSLLGLLVLVSVVVVAIFGLKQSVDFTGGTYLELAYENERPTSIEIERNLKKLDLGSISVQPMGEHNFILRTRSMTETEHSEVLTALGVLPQNNAVREEQYSSIGPSIGRELKRQAAWGIALVILLIIFYVAIAFRKVGRIVPGWLYGIITIITLVHDILIPAAVFALLGYFIGAEADALFITALLAIMGYSINDTIIVLDRVRENLSRASAREQEQNFPEIVGKSLRETVARSINTSFTTLLVLLALIFIGSQATRWFALTLAIGVVAGSYSSIFLASPLLVILQEARKRRK